MKQLTPNCLPNPGKLKCRGERGGQNRHQARCTDCSFPPRTAGGPPGRRPSATAATPRDRDPDHTIMTWHPPEVGGSSRSRLASSRPRRECGHLSRSCRSFPTRAFRHDRLLRLRPGNPADATTWPIGVECGRTSCRWTGLVCMVRLRRHGCSQNEAAGRPTAG